MKQRFVGIFWGFVLILVGAYFLVTQTTSLSIEDPRVALVGAGVLSALFFASYFVNGREHWGWLFPAFIFLGIAAAMVALIINPAINGSWVPFLILISVAAPFIVAYFLAPRPNWWALIPAYALTIIALIPLLAEGAPGELVGAVILWAIALPFLVVYLRNRSRWWALIPAGVLGLIGLIPLLTLGISEDIAGGIILLMIAAPFFVVYFWNQRENWWALIPAGILASIGLAVAASALAQPAGEMFTSRLMLGLMFFGWALTFAVLWLRRAVTPTEWAIYPAAGLGVLAAAGLIGGEEILQFAFPLALIVVGGWMLWRWQRRR